MQLTQVRTVLEAPGPYWTVHTEVGRPTEDAAQQIEARWTTLRHQLEHDGLDAGLLDDIGTRLRENTHLPGEVRRTIVANADRVLLDDVQAGHSARPEVTERADLPDLSGWLSGVAARVPFLLVVTDRTGADVETYHGVAGPPDDSATVEGDTFYITKVAEGDWAQKQFQQTAEDTWHHNAVEVADEVRRAAKRLRPRLVLVAGDVRARREVTDDLRKHESGVHDATVVELDAGGRAAGASREALWREVRRVLAETDAAEDAALADRLAEARRSGAGAAHGVDEVMAALAEARVDTLVLDDRAVADRTVHPTRYPGLALPPAAAEAEELPADRAMLAAAVLTGADVRLLPAGLAHGGGAAALLRWEE
jgi:hypothetical protein